MRDAFGVTLDEYIYFGGYPGPVHMIKDERRWRKYIKDSLVAPAIEKDVIMTSNIYKPALMKQLFELEYEVYYWREPSRNKEKIDKDNEVDFIIARDGEVTAIEVKSGRRGMNSGLPTFVETFHPKRSFVVGTGGVSLEDFLNSEVEIII